MTGCRNLRKRKTMTVEPNEVMPRVKKQTNTKKIGVLDDKENVCAKKENSKILTSKVNATKNILQENLIPQDSRKRQKTLDEKDINALRKVPIWKRNLNFTKSELRKKRIKKIDVYDIAFDEELMASEVTVKGKTAGHVTSKVKGNVIKRKRIPNAVKRKTKPKGVALIDNSTDKPLHVNKAVKQILPAKTISVASPDNGCLQSENGEQESVPNELAGDDIIEVIPEDCVPSEIPVPNPKPQDRYMFLSQFADELEKSFSSPRMTSTPAEHVSHVQKQPALKQKTVDVSYVQCVAKESANTVQNDPITENISNEDNNITLFESPTKKQKVLKQQVIKFPSPNKAIQINLFDEDPVSPSSPNELEESVLQPAKAYHTPDNFKLNLVKAKRHDAIQKKEQKKSKQDMMIEKLVQHFDEIGDTELCVE